jgi:outer membrane receptor protein involved in Fe transport
MTGRAAVGRRCRNLPLALAGVLAAASPAAADASRRIDIAGGSLARALAELARETGTELLYDERLLAGRDSKPVRGRMPVRSALSALLAGSGLAYRNTSGGAFVLYRPPPAAQVRGSAEPEPEPVAVPEILVVGRRSQNADIQRTRSDVQPYKVLTRRDIEGVHREDIEQLIRSREPANVQVLSPSQQTAGGDTRSSFDLRGLGQLRTLVLVDGRRMPGFPTAEFDFGQPDVNGIPLGAIERVETRTGTAGGIYGPNALGGVVNLVLERDYRGGELRVASGITSRGDVPTLSIEGRIGFTPNRGRTNVMLVAAHRAAGPLYQGDRDYALRQRRLQFANDPAGYAALAPRSNSVGVFGFRGGELVFDPQFGGQPLGSSFTFLPIGFSGTPAEARELLKRNAGQLVLDLPDEPTGTRAQLVAEPTVSSAIASVRHSFSDRVEAYLDGLYLRNSGRQEYGEAEIPITLPDATINPFQQFVLFRFPRPDSGASVGQRLDASRLTAGLIVRLPADWSASADYTIGAAKLRRNSTSPVVSFDLLNALLTGLPGPGGRPVPDPLGPWQDFVAAASAYSTTGFGSARLVNRFADATARVAGPVMKLPGGPLTGTLLLNRRREHVPDSTVVARFPSIDRVREVPVFERSQIVSSAYGELRAPLTGDGVPLLRDLELQLALRFDRALSLVPNGVGQRLLPEERPRRSERNALTYTVGAKFLPLRRLMLRASIATGELPPSLAGLEGVAFDARPSLGPGGPAAYADPERGGRPVGSERSVRILYGGLASSPPERAFAIAAGAVLNPRGGRWPRLSIDFSRIRRSREPLVIRSLLGLDLQRALGGVPGLLAAGDDGRLQRAPLTPQDQALGFTAGPVTQADLRGLFLGRSLVEAVDAELDWTVAAGAAGAFKLYGSATWQPTLKRRLSDGEPWIDFAGDTDGPLAWRGHGGVDWTRGRLAIGLNVQHYGSYEATYTDPYLLFRNAEILRFQGRERIAAQTFFDLSVRRRFGDSFELSLGVVNLLDRSPEIEAEPANRGGYSFYGDPRRRRFELAVSSRF